MGVRGEYIVELGKIDVLVLFVVASCILGVCFLREFILDGEFGSFGFGFW